MPALHATTNIWEILNTERSALFVPERKVWSTRWRTSMVLGNLGTELKKDQGCNSYLQQWLVT